MTILCSILFKLIKISELINTVFSLKGCYLFPFFLIHLFLQAHMFKINNMLLVSMKPRLFQGFLRALSRFPFVFNGNFTVIGIKWAVASDTYKYSLIRNKIKENNE